MLAKRPGKESYPQSEAFSGNLRNLCDLWIPFRCMLPPVLVETVLASFVVIKNADKSGVR